MCDSDDTGELGGVFKHEGDIWVLGRELGKLRGERPGGDRGQSSRARVGTHSSPTRDTVGPEQGQ